MFPLAAALGWAGDGSPGDGSLRNFAVGAVVQHFPEDPEPGRGQDFRLPTADELDAMEAFQLSLGRQAGDEPQPERLPGPCASPTPSVAQGQNLFFNGAPSPAVVTPRTCSGCHTQAGAGTPNRNRATGPSARPWRHRACRPGRRTATAASARAPASRAGVTVNGQTRRTSTRARW